MYVCVVCLCIVRLLCVLFGNKNFYIAKIKLRIETLWFWNWLFFDINVILWRLYEVFIWRIPRSHQIKELPDVEVDSFSCVLQRIVVCFYFYVANRLETFETAIILKRWCVLQVMSNNTDTITCKAWIYNPTTHIHPKCKHELRG